MKTRWQDWVMLVLAVWLFVAPFWMPAYASSAGTAAWNSYVLAVLIAIFAIAALTTPQRWEEWIELVLGIWLVISPFVLAFYQQENGASWNQIIVGVLVGLDAIWLLAAQPTLELKT